MTFVKGAVINLWSPPEEDPLEQLEELLGIEETRLKRIKNKYLHAKINEDLLCQFQYEIQKIDCERKFKDDDRLYMLSRDWFEIMLKEVLFRMGK